MIEIVDNAVGVALKIVVEDRHAENRDDYSRRGEALL